MSGYSWISGISIFCYLFLLLSFLSSKKPEGVIKSFEVLLVIMILWTGGSAGMRLQIWPGVNFWHHVSLLGMMLLPFGYYGFLLDFLDEKSGYMRPFLLVLFISVFIFNCFT
ncbi:MAG: diguanylate cyclase, partial [Anaerotignum sp.]|nr:diguanylate cyclase [Anaerotignum sp.]